MKFIVNKISIINNYNKKNKNNYSARYQYFKIIQSFNSPYIQK